MAKERSKIIKAILKPWRRLRRRKREAASPIGQLGQLEPQRRTFHDDDGGLQHHQPVQQSPPLTFYLNPTEGITSTSSASSLPLTSNPESNDITVNTDATELSCPSPSPCTTMAPERELKSNLNTLHTIYAQKNPQDANDLLSRSKLCLLQLNALLPQPSTPAAHLAMARETLELGALFSIRHRDTDSFTRYVQQLQPFYALPASRLPKEGGNASKITGLYLLLLLSQGDYLSFHMVLEALELAGEGVGGGVADDDFIQYPVRLEQALMEGSYDRVWGETKGERVPGEEFEVFSEVLIHTIRNEIASCSEKAYGSVPISNAKNLFFLESEGAVTQFAEKRGWTVKDGRIWFPWQDQDLLASERDILSTSGQVIENTLGYARELETIV